MLVQMSQEANRYRNGNGNIVGSQLLERGRWNYALIHGKSIITATCYFQGENIILWEALYQKYSTQNGTDP